MGREVALVTGGIGFAAKHVVRLLLEQTDYDVRILDLAPALPEEEDEPARALGAAIREGRARYVQADLRSAAAVLAAFEGVAVVFHMAAPNPAVDDFGLHYEVTVEGTRNVVAACVARGVRRLVYTSSPSVVFDGQRPIVGADESAPIPDAHNDYYSESKAQAEAIVLGADGRWGQLRTCAIRPSGIFGPGDRVAVPVIIAAARAGKLRYFIGDGQNLFEWTYVENVAAAHLCADRALAEGGAENVAAGKAYFVTNDEPIKFWEFLGRVVEGLGYAPPKRGLPVGLLLPFAYLVEWSCTLLKPFGVRRPEFSPARLRIVSSTRTFNIARAKELLRYSPPVSLDEGIRRTVESFSHLKKEALVHHPK